MEPENFIGIDISKVTLEICIVNVKGDQIAAYKTANTESYIVNILEVLGTNYKATPQNSCFCVDDMGLFGSLCARYLPLENIGFVSNSRFVARSRSGFNVVKTMRSKRSAARYACTDFNSLRFRTVPRRLKYFVFTRQLMIAIKF